MGLFGRKAKAELVTDPVCKMQIEPARAAGTEQHDGEPFYFCSDTCLKAFQADPHKYAHGH